MKTFVKVSLIVSVVLLAYFCIMSIVTPIEFDNTRQKREKLVIARLIDLRKAQLEFQIQEGRFVSTIDSLINFVKVGKKKVVAKEGALTDVQLEAGLNERKALQIVRSGNKAEIEKYGLQGFKRDTTIVDVITDLYKGKYTVSTIDQIAYIPFAEKTKFELEVVNNYHNNIGIRMPLFEIRAPYKVFLHDLEDQELLNLVDRQVQLSKYPGMKVGSVTEPNNNAGNWE